MGKINCSDDMLFEKTVASETVFEGKVFSVEIKEILTPEGRKSTREIVKHNGGACILPVDEQGNCSLVKLFIGTELDTGDANPDLNEYVSTVKIPLAEALQMADSGEIEDSKTLVLLYKASRRLGI